MQRPSQCRGRGGVSWPNLRLLQLKIFPLRSSRVWSTLTAWTGGASACCSTRCSSANLRSTGSIYYTAYSIVSTYCCNALPLRCDEDELFWSICNEAAYFPRFLSREAKQVSHILQSTHRNTFDNPSQQQILFLPKNIFCEDYIWLSVAWLVADPAAAAGEEPGQAARRVGLRGGRHQDPALLQTHRLRKTGEKTNSSSLQT